jgi:hypothetical protein
MKPLTDNPDTSHENVSMLLPWYVNKTLRDTELKTVERHLSTCSICQHELVALQQLSMAVKTAPTFNSTAQPASFAQLKTRLQVSTEKNKPPTAQVIVFGKQQWRNPLKLKAVNSAPAPTLAFAAAVALMVLTPYFIYVQQIPSNDYKTLSNAEAISNNTNEIKVIFKDNTPQHAIKQTLAAIQGHITSGPNAQALYVIGFDNMTDSTPVASKLSLLRNNKHVVFAEPAYALLSKSQAKGARQ